MASYGVLEKELEKHFNYSSFRVGQKEIIDDILNGEDVLGILPTGSGKSICYQLPAILMDGLTVVVSPLISLMIDQVKQLRANHFKKVIALNSFMEPKEKRKVIKELHTYKLVYISPELLQQETVLKRIEQLKISLFVIDEAHCISQWGHEFRPDYLKLDSVIKRLHDPTTLALSATCPPQVQDDIKTALKKPEMKKRIYPMDRNNITFCIEKVMDDQEKIDRISQLLKDFQVPTLIYFNSRRAAEECVRVLYAKLPNRKIAFYHGGMEQMDRIIIQQQFMNNQLDVICCTNAFGMGINKNDIRLIIHYHFPLQLESFIQEVGRAGRDGRSSVSLLFYSPNDVFLPSSLIKNELPSDETLQVVFNHLFILWQNKMTLPSEESQLENLYQINETQWRFLRYQFEKHGMIKGKQIIYDEYNWKRAFQLIHMQRDNRLHHKENKLSEIIKWINEKDCLRKHLYKNFQSGYSKPIDQCCSNCGFSWSDWKPVETVSNHYSPQTWERRLQEILLIGESNEAK